ncbi:portal protein [Methylorubrum extorquens]
MAFQPGQSGNPGGRPKAAGRVRDAAREHTEAALAVLVQIATAGESEAARVAAANAILDRGYGKPTQTADVIAGMVRYVENRSDAPSAYFAAADQQVGAGIGHWKVITEYGSDTTFEQEIRIVGVPDGVGVRWDPDAVLPTREDAKFCFVPVDISRDVYEETYPDHPAAEIGDSELSAAGMAEWAGTDMVRIAEYYTKTPVQKTLALMPDGEILDLTDEAAEDHAEKMALVEAAKAEGARVRVEKRPGHRVERYVISANAVLDGPTEIPGRFIPVVPVVGVEMTIGKRRARRGVIRFAKDAQRAYNYARSTQTEVVALQPKSPFVGTEKMFKGYEAIWDTANSTNHPFLPYNVDQSSPTARPERSTPPIASAGLAELTREAAEDMKAVTGVYDASLGARSNETSGKAIQARQREGDVGSFVYIVNFSRSIRHTGAIVCGMIPHVYDTARTLRIVGEDGKVDLVQINQVGGLAEDGQPLDKIQNDVTVGAYDVAMEMGPSYTTRREAALDGMLQLVAAAPNLAPPRARPSGQGAGLADGGRDRQAHPDHAAAPDPSAGGAGERRGTAAAHAALAAGTGGYRAAGAPAADRGRAPATRHGKAGGGAREAPGRRAEDPGRDREGTDRSRGARDGGQPPADARPGRHRARRRPAPRRDRRRRRATLRGGLDDHGRDGSRAVAAGAACRTGAAAYGAPHRLHRGASGRLFF